MKRTHAVIFWIMRLAAWSAVGLLLAVLLLLFMAGHQALGWNFLTRAWQHRDITRGGILQAVVGTVGLGLGVTAVSFPLGVTTAIYVTEYAHRPWIKRLLGVCVRNLAGVPSVVYGLFGLALFVHGLRLGTSLISASLTLSLMVLPQVVSSSVEALKAVPDGWRNSSLALGADRWQTTWRVVLPAALSGCLTGGVVGLARALGETAPLIMVGATFYMSGYPHSPFDKFMALPYHAFILATQHASPLAPQFAAATAFTLIIITFALSLGAIAYRHRLRRKHAR